MEYTFETCFGTKETEERISMSALHVSDILEDILYVEGELERWLSPKGREIYDALGDLADKAEISDLLVDFLRKKGARI